MRINKRNFWIYLVGLVISLSLIVVYFIDPSNSWCTVSVSVGASGVGAVILAYLIECSNEKTRQENIRAVRLSKLNLIETLATRLLEVLVGVYFKKRKVLLDDSDRDTCYKISCNELWGELCIQGEYLGQPDLLNDDSLSTAVSEMDNEVRRFSEATCKYIDGSLSDLIPFEAIGFFSDDEISTLRYVGTLSGFVWQSENFLNVEDLKLVFEQLATIKEFEHLTTVVFYCKGIAIDYTSSKKTSTTASVISEDDRKNAVSALERKDYPNYIKR